MVGQPWTFHLVAMGPLVSPSSHQERQVISSSLVAELEELHPHCSFWQLVQVFFSKDCELLAQSLDWTGAELEIPLLHNNCARHCFDINFRGARQRTGPGTRQGR